MRHFPQNKALPWLLLGACLLLATGCQSGDSDDADPQVGGESHWLLGCESAMGCGEGEICLCGICTTPCQGDDACAQGSSCTEADSCDVSVCRAGCESDADCDAGRCQEGACVVEPGQYACDGTQLHQELAGDLTLVRGEPVSVDAEGCVELGSASGVHCAQEDTLVDAILDGDQVLFQICSPSLEEASPLDQVEPSGGARTLAPQDNGQVYSIGEETLAGDVDAQGSRVALYGQGRDVSTLGGSVALGGNNARLRSLAVDGDLEISGNGAAAVDVRVTGSVTLSGNNTALVDVEILGDLEISGNNTTLMGVGVGGQLSDLSQKVDFCQGCYSFEDADQDGAISPQEHTGSICPDL